MLVELLILLAAFIHSYIIVTHAMNGVLRPYDLYEYPTVQHSSLQDTVVIANFNVQGYLKGPINPWLDDLDKKSPLTMSTYTKKHATDSTTSSSTMVQQWT